MSTQYRKAVRSRLYQHCDQLDQAIRDISTLAECEHPDWGEPGAEAAHEAALEIVRPKKARPKKVLTPGMLHEIRKNSRVSAGLSWSTAPSSNRSQDAAKSPRSLQPSSLELAKQENLALALRHEPDPEDVALPDDEDEKAFLPQSPAPTCTTSSLPSITATGFSSQCKTITTRALAALMRRHDRCAITPAALEQLQALRDTASKQIAQIDAAQKKFRARLRERNTRRWRRSFWRPEHEHYPHGSVDGKREYFDKALALAHGMGSPLSFYTAVEDADDPWGQRDARCERGRELGAPLLWGSAECGSAGEREAKW